MRKVAPGSRRGIGGRPAGPPTAVVRLPVPVANLARQLATGELRAGDVAAFLDVRTRTVLAVPLVGGSASCGFPSPADDHMDKPLDFNELLVAHPAATFAVRIAGESMIGAGLLPGGLAIVDRSIPPASGRIVLALLGNEFTIKRYCLRGKAVLLRPENPAFAELLVSPEMGFEVWGVVTHAINPL